MCCFSDFKKRNHVTAGFRKKNLEKMNLPLPWFWSSFWKVKKKKKKKKLPNWETCLTGHDTDTGL